MSCGNDCSDPREFPRRIDNRAGLDAIDYRIGDYTAMRAHILTAIDAAPELVGWTHRRADDPGIALVEAAAMVGDILALYQQAYANEAFVRTAAWRDSVATLVRVLGYRLAPGLGGRARFAVAVKGARPMDLAKGFAITVKLPSTPKPAQFETTEAFTAWAALSKFHLYRPRFVPSLANGMNVFQLDAGNPIELAKGDRLLVGTAEGHTLRHTQVLVVEKVWEAFGIRHVQTQGRLSSLLGMSLTAPGPSFGTVVISPMPDAPSLASPVLNILSGGLDQALSVLSSGSAAAPGASSGGSSPTLGAFSGASSPASGFLSMSPGYGFVTITPSAGSGLSSAVPSLERGMLTSGLSFLRAYSGLLHAGLAAALWSQVAELRAYKLGPSSRHFGHNAPPTRVAIDASGHATEVGIGFARRLDGNQGDPAAPTLRSVQWPLDGEPAGFAAGTLVLVEANLSESEGGSASKRVIERRVTQLDRQSLAWGVSTGASTVLTLGDELTLREGSTTRAWTDIRGVTIHAVQGEPFRLRAASQPTAASRGHALDYFGRRDEALALKDRSLLVTGSGAPRPVQVRDVAAGAASADPQFHTLTLDTDLTFADFPHEEPSTEVYGNLVETTEGKTEAEVPIGDGDARQSFQTFVLPKAPLTYLLDTGAQPPQVPELEIRVGGLLWQRVPSLFGRGPKETVYIVRESADGASSCVQFGDGRTGARLPSGRSNVVALWRTGSGARGLPADSDKPQAARRLPGFDDVWMLEPATGGAVPESAANARRAAPATMQSLGRIVSLADLEAEALALPGVLKARATWQTLDGSPLVALTVLPGSGTAADAAAIDLALRHALATRGPARWSLQVRHGTRRRIAVDMTVAIDPAVRSEDVRAALRVALGVEDDDPADDLDLGERGLMHWRMRDFGQPVHGSQLVGAAQSVPGVRWVDLHAMSLSFATPLVSSGGTSFTQAAFAPLALASLGAPPVRRSLRAGADELLSLASQGLQLRFSVDLEGSTEVTR